MKVDFIADLVCPWCYLGWRALRQAVERRPDAGVSLAWRAYQLDPKIPDTGVDRQAYLAAKYPDRERTAGVGAALRALADELGAPLAMERITITPNTAAAHRLIRWAEGVGTQAAAVDALFAAYFVEGRDIGDPDTLADIGATVGLGRLDVLGRLSEGVDIDTVAVEHQTAVEAGVTGVPFVVFSGRFGVMGAQSPERYLKAIDKLSASEIDGGGDQGLNPVRSPA